MKTPERCIPWQPVPPAVNRYTVLEVEEFAQRALAEGAPVAVTVVSAVEHTAPGQAPASAWRIRFEWVTGYRCRPTDQPLGSTPVVFPEGPGGSQAATWEVVYSRWLPEAVGTLYGRPSAVRHFVIASTYAIYDIAAERWTSEALREQEPLVGPGD